jgi:hypothetical protein
MFSRNGLPPWFAGSTTGTWPQAAKAILAANM